MRVDAPYWVCRRFRSALTKKLFSEVHRATRSWFKAHQEARRLHSVTPKEYWVVQENSGKVIARYGRPPCQ